MPSHLPARPWARLWPRPLLCALCAALVLSACGGSDDNPAPAPNPAPNPAPTPPATPPLSPIRPALPPSQLPQAQALEVPVELLAGTLRPDGVRMIQRCEIRNTSALDAAFAQVRALHVSGDAVYALDTGRGCFDIHSYISRPGPVPGRAKVLRIAQGRADVVMALNDFSGAGQPPFMVRHPSGFHVDAQGRVLVLSNALDYYGPTTLEPYAATQAWRYYSPGLFRREAHETGLPRMIFGNWGDAPSLRDGDAQTARFSRPDRLRQGPNGELYFVDGGKIRKISRPDAGGVTTTLTEKDFPALAWFNENRIVDMEVDAKGHIHVLYAKDGYQYDYVWLNLNTGRVRLFSTRPPGATFGLVERPRDTFTLVGDDMVFSSAGDQGAYLMRISGETGAVRNLKGTGLSGFGDNPFENIPFNDVRYGPDGHLYLAQRWGILVMRNFK